MKRTFEFAGLRYPSSFLQLLLGFGLVSLPLILALLNATAYVDRLTTQSQAAIDQAAETARGSAFTPHADGDGGNAGGDKSISLTSTLSGWESRVPAGAEWLLSPPDCL
jgi:hypothetical protein